MKTVLIALMMSASVSAFDYQDGDLCGYLNYQYIEEMGMTYVLTLDGDNRIFTIKNGEFTSQMKSIVMNHSYYLQDQGASVCFYDANAVEVRSNIWSIEYFSHLEENY